jgi:hypothetical protein
VPFVSPVTVQVSGPLVHPHVLLPVELVTVYATIVVPPLDAGAVHETVACALPATAMTFVGAPGRFPTEKCQIADVARTVPAALSAFTRQ